MTGLKSVVRVAEVQFTVPKHEYRADKLGENGGGSGETGITDDSGYIGGEGVGGEGDANSHLN